MKKVIVLIILVVVLGFWYNCNSYTSEPVVNHISKTVDKYIAPEEKCYHYSQLDESGKFVYDELLRQVPGGVAEFSVKDVPVEAMQDDNFETIIDAFYKDHPEFFWLCNGYEWTYHDFFARMDLKLNVNEFWDDTSDKNKMVDKLFKKFDKITAEAREIEDKYEQIKFVYDYLIDNITYDENAAKEMDKDEWSIETAYAYTGYGALVNGLCVCEGYAKAFQLIIQNLGYECILASGEGGDDLHSWNMVKIDDDYYYFDVTWDDAGDDFDEDGKLIYADGNSHEYFAVTSKEFAREHESQDFEYPLCTATDYNYFCREGYVVEEYNEPEIKAILKKQFDEGLSEISIKFTDKKTMTKSADYVSSEMERMMSSYRYYNHYESYYIYENDKMYVITYNFV